MTEQHPSFGGVAVADPRTSTSPLDLGNESAPEDNRRKLALVGAIVAVVVVLIAAFFMLKGSGGGDNAVVPPHIVPPASTGQAATGATAVAAPKPIKLPKPFAGVVGRDPFKALYVEPAPKTPAAAAPTGPSSNPVVVTPVAPVTTTGGSTSSSTSTGSTGGAQSVGSNFDPVWVELVHVTGTKSATFVVGYTNGKRSTQVTYSVAAPQNSTRTVFGRVFSLLSIQNGTVTVQMGDGTPFDLAKGFGNRHFLG